MQNLNVFGIQVLLFWEFCLYLQHITDNNNLKQSNNEDNEELGDGCHPDLRCKHVYGMCQ